MLLSANAIFFALLSFVFADGAAGCIVQLRKQRRIGASAQ